MGSGVKMENKNLLPREVSEIFLAEIGGEYKDNFNKFFEEVINISLKDREDVRLEIIKNNIDEIQAKHVAIAIPKALFLKYKNECKKEAEKIIEETGSKKKNIVRDADVLKKKWNGIFSEMTEEDVKLFTRKVFGHVDFAVYLKIFEHCELSAAFTELIKNNYGVDLTQKKFKEVFEYARAGVRNKDSHKSENNIQEYRDRERMQKAIDTYGELYRIFRTEELDAKYGERFSMCSQRCRNIMWSVPHTLEWLQKETPIIANENSLKILFKNAYDTKNRILYGYVDSELVELHNSLLSGAEAMQVGMPAEKSGIDEDNVVRKYKQTDDEEALPVLSRMNSYAQKMAETGGRVQLSTEDWNELADNCVILCDTSSLLPGNRFNQHRQYFFYELMPLLHKRNNIPVVDYCTRVELNLMSVGENEAKKRDAKHTRNAIDQMSAQRNLMFLRKPQVIYKHGYLGITEIINEHPDVRFVVMTQSLASMKYINNNTKDNCLIVAMYAMQTPAYSAVEECDSNRVYRFANYTLDSQPEAVLLPQPDLVPQALLLPQAVVPEQHDQASPDSSTVAQPFLSDSSDRELKHGTKADSQNNVQTVCVAEKQSNIKKQKKKSVVQNNDAGTVFPPLGSVPCVPETKIMLEIDGAVGEGTKLTDESGVAYVLKELLGSGGEGDVYVIDDNHVAKIYHTDSLTKNRYEKLQLMVKNNPHIEKLCWPEKLLYNNHKQFAGYIMARVPENFKPVGRSVLKLGNPAKTVKDLAETKGMKGLDKWNRKSLVSLCRSISQVFIKLHSKNILMGDVNINNFLVNTANTNGGDFKIVDCDSFQVGSYPCPVGVDIFTSPEIYKRTGTDHPQFGMFLRTREDDQYSLASMLFHILMFGQQPYAGKGEDTEESVARRSYNFPYRSDFETGTDAPEGCYALIWDNTPKTVREKFVTIFKGVGTVSAEEWVNAFREYNRQIDNKLATDELMPRKYREIKGRKLVNITCSMCDQEANMFEGTYRYLSKYHAMTLCGICLSLVPTLERRTTKVVCEKCKKEYNENLLTALSNEWGDTRYQHLICPDCKRKSKHTCEACGKEVYLTDTKYNDITQHSNGHFYCFDCLKSEQETCAKCGKPIKVQKYKLIKNPNKKWYCNDCRQSWKR